jgi:hypothetical protein
MGAQQAEAPTPANTKKSIASIIMEEYPINIVPTPSITKNKVRIERMLTLSANKPSKGEKTV